MSGKRTKLIRKAVEAASLPKMEYTTIIEDTSKLGIETGRYQSRVNHERRIRRAMRRQNIRFPAVAIWGYRLQLDKPKTAPVKRNRVKAKQP